MAPCATCSGGAYFTTNSPNYVRSGINDGRECDELLWLISSDADVDFVKSVGLECRSISWCRPCSYTFYRTYGYYGFDSLFVTLSYGVGSLLSSC